MDTLIFRFPPQIQLTSSDTHSCTNINTPDHMHSHKTLTNTHTYAHTYIHTNKQTNKQTNTLTFKGEEAYGSFCYWVVTNAKSWVGAKSDCALSGGNLVSIADR